MAQEKPSILSVAGAYDLPAPRTQKHDLGGAPDTSLVVVVKLARGRPRSPRGARRSSL